MLSRTNLFVVLVALATAAIMLLALGNETIRAAELICDESGCYILHTTPDDFVRGRFYGTGLRKKGDGEVQLLPVGLTTPWTEAAPLPAPRAELALVSYNNILYAIGGYDGTVYHTEVYSASTSLIG